MPKIKKIITRGRWREGTQGKRGGITGLLVGGGWRVGGPRVGNLLE